MLILSPALNLSPATLAEHKPLSIVSHNPALSMASEEFLFCTDSNKLQRSIIIIHPSISAHVQKSVSFFFFFSAKQNKTLSFLMLCWTFSTLS